MGKKTKRSGEVVTMHTKKAAPENFEEPVEVPFNVQFSHLFTPL